MIDSTRKGHWETRVNIEIQNRIVEIENYLNSYEKIKDNLSKITPIANESSVDVLNSYNYASEGIVIGNEVNLMEGINKLATNVTDMYESILQITSLIDNEVKKLNDELQQLKGKINYQIWVYDD